jgi:DNA-binding response OmpR family regulator
MAKVLVLDDVLDAVNLIKRILKATGHEVVGFTEEEEALNYARTNPVDLAILDIKLKKNKWFGGVRGIKKNSTFHARHYAHRISYPGDGPGGAKAGGNRVLR